MKRKSELKIDYSKYVIIIGKRVFIDIAESGCGSGCVYCYIKDANSAQRLLSEDAIRNICRYVESMLEVDGDTIISLCPNTEPLKCAESIELIKIIISFFAKTGAAVQISTKEYVDEDFLKYLDTLSLRENQITINVSVPCISDSDVLEPNACSVSKRLESFDNLNRHIKINSCLYVKPFMNGITSKDLQPFVDCIRKYAPKYVCVGIAFFLADKNDVVCTTLYHEEEARSLFGSNPDLFDFADALGKMTNKPVFFSSVCIVSNCYSHRCTLNLADYDEKCCRECSLLNLGGRCSELERKNQ